MAPKRPPDHLDLVGFEWATGRPIHRVHPTTYGPAAFNPSASATRFRPIYNGKRIVPTLYGGEDFECALSETVFHEVPLLGLKQVAHSELTMRARSVLVPTRTLLLAELHGAGLRRLGVRNADLIDFDDANYVITQEWGQKIYDSRDVEGERLDGIVWMSRQFNSRMSLMLFASIRGDSRVSPKDLTVVEADSRIPLDEPQTLEMVWRAANRADIMIAEPGER